MHDSPRTSVTPSPPDRGVSPPRRRPRLELMFARPETKAPRYRPHPASWRDDTATLAWIGQSSVLMNFFGVWILTDPVFSPKIGPRIFGRVLGPRRLTAPALPEEGLPPLDLILLSHAHMDHCDLPTLRRLDRSVPVVAAKATSDVFAGLRFARVRELDWGETASEAGVSIEALRVNHFGWRWPWERDRSKGYADGRSYNAYLLERNGVRIVFGGDTAMQSHFAEIGRRGRGIDLAMMPIGAYDPWIRAHCTPEQAIAMAEDLGARRIMPMHWGTFIQSDEPEREPIERFRAALGRSRLEPTIFEHGETWSLDGGMMSIPVAED